jgi:2-polyprenyl-3-methyl-5-hydroxy-6-metoxy-1,4-benzoquinol methylase
MVTKVRNKPAKGQLEEEASFWDDYLRGQYTGRNWFERWLVSLHPAAPNPRECTNRLLAALGQIDGKHICEIGCGRGLLTWELANRGARVLAIDISMEAVKMALERNKEFGGRVDVRQMDVSSLPYNDEPFDLVTGIWILHHLDRVEVAEKISRLLKPGGKAVFIEPLAHNPISNVWRRLTPSFRTLDEKPLSYSEIGEMSRYFNSVNYEEFDLLPLLSSLVYLVTFSRRAKERSAELLARLEPSFLKVCQPLRRYSGEILVEFAK